MEMGTKRIFVEKLLKMPPELADEQTAGLMGINSRGNCTERLPQLTIRMQKR